MVYLWLFLASCLSAVLYRMGGMGDEGRKKFPNVPAWFFDSKARDIGCSLVTVGITGGLSLLPNSPWWAYLLSFLLLFGALTTYWDFLFGYDNFWMHGAMCGLAFAPFMWFDEPLALGIRIAVLAILMGAWSAVVGKDWLEEGGRGFFLPITLVNILWI